MLYLVDRCADVPNSWYNSRNYRKLAVVERNDGKVPERIEDTKEQKVIALAPSVYKGYTNKCQWAIRVKEFEALIKQRTN